jgi:rRNA maturation RNase YbeY
MDDFPIPISEGLTITFNHADTDYLPPNSDEIINWLQTIIKTENGNVAELNYIFCSDTYLHKLNVEYLDHDTLTDIITFPINRDPIQSDIFISIDRVRENAIDRNLTKEVELHRVVVHGLLHLLGYGDKSPEEKEKMRSKENTYLQSFGKY